MTTFLSKYKIKQGDLNAESGSSAEEAFTSIRIVKAFSIQKQLSALFNETNHGTLKWGRRTAFVTAACLAACFSSGFFSYGRVVWFGIPQ